MAEALLSIPLEIAINKLLTFIEEKIGLIASASDDVSEIQDKLHLIKAVLKDAERKQSTDESVRVWLLKLKSFALDIEDVVEEWQISSDHSKSLEAGGQFKEIRERLDEIYGDTVRSSLVSGISSTSVGGGSETLPSSGDWRQTSSLVEESDIMGRDKDKETVMSWLVNDALDGQQQQQHQEVHVTAIVGVGGLGKTTLARQIFNDPKVKDHFSQGLYWICVSDVFDVKKLTIDIIEAVNPGEGAAAFSTQLNVLQNKLFESLKGKRFLLVLDDVWNEDYEKWKTLRLSLKSGAQGSRILVTTRSIKVAEIMNARPFTVGGENVEYCGIDEQQELNTLRGRLEIMGLDRVAEAEQAASAPLRKKHGVRKLSLDISSRKRKRVVEDDKEEERIKVLERLRPHPNLQKLELKGDSISKLRLPSWLEDPSFSNLSRLEISGFENWKPNNSMPGLGKLPGLKYLKISGCGVKKLGDEFYYGNGIGTTSAGRGVAFPNLESLNLQNMGELEEWELTGEADASKVMPCLRELVVQCCCKLQLLPSHLFTAATPPTSSTLEVPEASKNYCHDELKPLPPSSEHVSKPLERLQIVDCDKLQSLPQSLGQLKKLKSLKISGAGELTRLPDSLGQLESLGTLDIHGCDELKSLPDSVGGLKKLKSLKISAVKKMESLPESLGQLTSLESLQIYHWDKLKSLPHSLGRLQKLQELRIEKCPQLPYNSNGRREDWPEISHIKTIEIDGKRLCCDEAAAAAAAPAMAEALLSILLETAINKLLTFTGEKIGLIASASKDVREIRGKLHSIKAVVMDAERKQITDESVRVWLLKLKGVALDIEDVVEWQISSGHSKSLEAGGQFKEIRERLDEIYGDTVRSSLVSGLSSTSVGGGSETLPSSRDWRQTSSLVEESDIIGRDKDKETVISWLVNDALDGQQQQQQEVHVTAIVGVGGLGKTTLARQIFNDPRVKDHFNQDLYWVCVSDVFDVMKLTKDIIEAVKPGVGAAAFSTQLNVLQNKLRESLKGKRFLLVLDDVWNEDYEKWNKLRVSLKSGAEGSRILVTTRKIKVAEVMNASSSRIHELEGLTDDLSWKLFCGRAFPEKTPEEFSEFESIGKKIVKKCNGVPLSIKVMGGTMNEKWTMADWENILNSEMWSLPEVKDRILPDLQISYYNLPPSLKPCFSYCSIFKKDTVMKKNELVHLWVAQGFIRPEGNRVPEDIGEGYFNGLVVRSMFQEVGEDDRGIITCKMHDLLHDLATVITEDENYIFTESKNSNPPYSSIGGVRHASLILDGDNASISLASCPRKKLRTLVVNDLHETRGVADKLFGEARFIRALVFRDCQRMNVLPKAIGKLKHLTYLDLSGSSIADLPEKAIEELNHLRYLDLSGTGIKELPDALEKMEQLRHLDLSETNIGELPKSVSRLVNLHTLNLNRCRRLKKLCGGLCNITGLRHLYIEGTWELDFLPKGIGKLTSLQTLRRFIVGVEYGEYCGIDELQELNALRGLLQIEGLDRVSEAEQAASAQLCKKHGVRELILDMSSYTRSVEDYPRSVEDDKEEERIMVLERLRPPKNLQKLEVRGYSRSKLRLPSWLDDPSFSNLSRLQMSGLRKWEPNNSMPGLGKLPGLKYLQILQCDVKKLGDEFYYGNGIGTTSAGRGVAFPKLESLTLKMLEELEEWELTGEADVSKVMPSLRELRVECCYRLLMLPSHLGTAATPPTSSTSEVPEAPASEHVSKPLERLEIFFCSQLQSLPQSLGQLKKLKSLTIMDLAELTCLPDSLGQLQSLETLKIQDCHKLKLLGQLGQLRKLKSLEIMRARELTCLYDSLGQLDSLETLQIVGCDKLKSLGQLEPSGQFRKLKSLEIRVAGELTCLPVSLGQLESLETLRISFCDKLKLPGQLEPSGQLRKLKSLKIYRAGELTGLPVSLGQLESLQTLEIEFCDKLKSPGQLAKLRKLKSLRIVGAGELTCLPESLGQLTSLETLKINDCDKLKSLPQSLGRLQKLQELQIRKCPQLPYNSNGRREDWPEISHIKTIEIDGKTL